MVRVKNPLTRKDIIEKQLKEEKKGDIDINNKKYSLKIKSKSGKLVGVNTQTAIKLLKKKNNTILGRKEVVAKAPYTEDYSKRSHGWVEVNYSRNQQTQLNKMCNEILFLAKGKKWVTVTLRFIKQQNFEGENIDEYEHTFKGFSIKDPEKQIKDKKRKVIGRIKNYKINSNELYDQVIESLKSRYFGSDGLEENYDIDTTFLKMSYKENTGNSKTGRKDCKVIKTKFFHSKSFKSKDGDCLLAIINNGKQMKQIRKDLELPEGGIDIKDIPKLEKYFKRNINVYENNIEIKMIELDNDKHNKTICEASYIFLYESKENHKQTFDILLYENHYSLITKKLPIDFDPICGELLKHDKKNPKRPIRLTKEQIEESLKKQGRPIINGKKKNVEYEEYYLFFDLETIFNRHNCSLLETYSVSWFEIKVSDDLIINEKNLKKYLDKTHFISGTGCMKKFIQWIDENDEGKKYYLIGYNNSKFDNFPLLRGLINNDMLNDILYVNNSLLKIHFSGRHTTFDLYKFTHASLKDACEGFKTYPEKVKGFSHYLPQDAFNKDGWNGLNTWIKNNKETIEVYNKTDVLATASLFYSVKNNYEKLVGKDILKYTTLAHLSYDCFNETNKDENGEKLAKTVNSEKLDNKIRESFTGGRNQKFNNSYENDEILEMLDVKSLYPYIMMNRYFPIGEYQSTNVYRDDKLGIYNVRIISQPKVKIIPNRGDTLDWEYKGEIKKRLTSVEIECLKRHGAEFEFIPWKKGLDCIGLYWEKYSKDLFRKFFVPIQREKTKQDEYNERKDKRYNPALRGICKLILNSLSGKFGQRNFKDNHKLCKTNNDEQKFIKNVKDDEISLIFQFGDYRILKGEKKPELVFKSQTAKPSQICAFIYAWARVYMYDILYSKYNVLYTDTDSALLKIKESKDFESKYLVKKGYIPHLYYDLSDKDHHYFGEKRINHIKTIGGDFGQLEKELNIKKGQKVEQYIIAKKLYAIEIKNKNGTYYCSHGDECKLGLKCPKLKCKYRMKGISISKDVLVSKEKAKEIGDSKKDMYKYYRDNQENKRDLLEPFRILSEKNECYYVTSQLKRKDFNIKQLYSIKQLKLNKKKGEVDIIED